MQHDVFISYSTKDKRVADALVHYLEERRIGCWIAPRDIAGGAEYADVIVGAIETTRIVLVLFSDAAQHSQWVRSEINRAMTLGKVIIPVKIADVIPEKGMGLYLGDRHWVDIYPDLETNFCKVLPAVHNALGRGNPFERSEEKAKQTEVHLQGCEEMQGNRKVRSFLPSKWLRIMMVCASFVTAVLAGIGSWFWWKGSTVGGGMAQDAQRNEDAGLREDESSSEYADSDGSVRWKYSVDKDGVTITGSDWGPGMSQNSIQKLNVPGFLDGCKVTGIGGGAFAGFKGLTSLRIPSSVTYIEQCAFAPCRNLTEIVVEEGNSSYSIHNNLLCNKEGSVVVGCPGGVRFVTVPSSATDIDYRAFQGCEELLSITIPSSVNHIGYAALEECDNLVEVVFEGLPPKELSPAAGIREDVLIKYPARYEISWAPVIKMCAFSKHEAMLFDLKPGDVMTVTLPGGATMEFVWCPAGAFMMGSPVSELDRKGDEMQHRLSMMGFWMGKYEVTQRQWESVMGSNPSSHKGEDLPVENVSWEDCQVFIGKINAAKRVTVALPTEAQWEYACRAGTTTAFNCGATLDRERANYDGILGRRGEIGLEGTKAVGSYPSNAWGLHDMHGNVSELCADWYGAYSVDKTDRGGLAPGVYRVSRGGGWAAGEGRCRSASRGRSSPDERIFSQGFRLVCSAVKK